MWILYLLGMALNRAVSILWILTTLFKSVLNVLCIRIIFCSNISFGLLCLNLLLLESTLFKMLVYGAHNFHSTSPISMSHESCDLKLSYDTLVTNAQWFWGCWFMQRKTLPKSSHFIRESGMKIAISKGWKELAGQMDKFTTKVSEKHGSFPFCYFLLLWELVVLVEWLLLLLFRQEVQGLIPGNTKCFF